VEDTFNVSLLPPGSSPLAPGFKLDRYELLCPIAEGGMASVWIARHTGKHGFEKFVAIKTVLPKFASDPRFQQMFQDEARIASRIEHTNVAQILDVGEQHDITYLVMEYVDGESLSTVHRTLVKKGMRIPPGVVLRTMADVCGGLHTAHELHEEDGTLTGVVHRDVSPQNVLLSTRGVAKLIDFGIAKARDRVAGDTNAGQVKGKIRYMAPEQALGSAIDRRADIWAVGAILYHMLSGKPPYDGENDVQALMVLTSGRPPVPLPPSVAPAVAAVVKRALMASPENRFATAAEMQQAIEDAMVASKLGANPATVAAFLAEHVADRAKRRKEAIAIGLKAAAEREKYVEIMRSNVRTTGGGTSSSQAGVGPPDTPSRTGAGSRPGSGSGILGSGPGVGTGPGSGPGMTSGTGAGGPSSLVTSGTLGSAAMDVGGGRPSRGRTLAIATAVVGGLAGIAGLVVTLVTREPSARAGAGSVGQPASVASPTGTATTVWTSVPVTSLPVASAPAATPEAASPAAATPATPVPSPPAAAFYPRPAAARPIAPTPAAKPVHTTNPTKTRVDDGF
jgi:eukaryotic-like serine/threonine-protein kinase